LDGGFVRRSPAQCKAIALEIAQKLVKDPKSSYTLIGEPYGLSKAQVHLYLKTYSPESVKGKRWNRKIPVGQTFERGQTFGQRQVEEEAPSACHLSKILCRCSCGKLEAVYAHNLLRGKSLSCKSCAQRILCAKRQGIEYEPHTNFDIEDLSIGSCFLCGEKIFFEDPCYLGRYPSHQKCVQGYDPDWHTQDALVC
jgi:hypothetical protein